jgi:hypothetical protein
MAKFSKLISNHLGLILLLACQPTQQAPSLRQAVMALRQA